MMPTADIDIFGNVKREDNWKYMTKLSMYDVRGGIDEHGSLMTPLIYDLLYGENNATNLNHVVGRVGKPVFHHGAEAQNHFFLQPLDSSIAVILPSDKELPSFLKTGVVTREHLGKVLASLQAHGKSDLFDVFFFFFT